MAGLVRAIERLLRTGLTVCNVSFSVIARNTRNAASVQPNLHVRLLTRGKASWWADETRPTYGGYFILEGTFTVSPAIMKAPCPR